MDEQPEDGLTVYNRDGIVIGRIRSFRCFIGNLPTAEFVVAWDAIDEMLDALRR